MSNLIKQTFFYKSHDKTVRELQGYIYSCGFLCHMESKRRIQKYIDCGCNAKNTLAALENVSYSALRSSVCHANKRLAAILGSDILDRALSGDDLAKDIIISASNTSKPLILKPVTQCIPRFNNERYSLEDCAAELLFLSRFSTCNMMYYLECMDMSKLSYLYHVITQPTDSDRALSLKLKDWLSTVCNAKPEDAAALIHGIQASKNTIQ